MRTFPPGTVSLDWHLSDFAVHTPITMSEGSHRMMIIIFLVIAQMPRDYYWHCIAGNFGEVFNVMIRQIW